MENKNWLSRLKVIMPILILVLFLVTIFVSAVGSANLDFLLIVQMLIYKIPFIGPAIIEPFWPSVADTILWDIRIPRIILGAIVGAALAVAGAAFQGLLRNPLADPYTLGVSSGAALGAVVVIIFGTGISLFGLSLVPFAAILMAILTITVVYNLARIGGKVATETIILSGVVVGAFFSAMLSFLLTLSYSNVEQVIFWLMGSLSLRSWSHVVFAIPFLVVGLLITWFYARELNVMVLGDDSAKHLGVDVERSKKILLFTASMLSAVAVSVSGTIGFMGLIIPHLVRMTIGPDHRVLIPVAAFTGAIFLILADTVARTIISPGELPVGVLTAFLGAPFFVYLLRSRRKSMSM